MLTHGNPCANDFIQQLDQAEVLPWRCPCGCASINFQIRDKQPAPPGVHVLGDYVFGEGELVCGIFIFESGGLLSGIEVYGMATGAPTCLPDIESLRPFGECLIE
jgi:hypothetical protein